MIRRPPPRIAWLGAALLALMWLGCTEGPTPTAPGAEQPRGEVAGSPMVGVIEGRVMIEGETLATIRCIGTNLSALADSEGHYTFLNMPFGLYDLRAEAEGHAPVIIGTVEITAEAPRATAPTVAMERRENLEPDTLPPPALGALTGRVTLAGDSDHGGITVTIQGTTKSDVTDSQGRWLIEGVEPGNRRILFSAPGHETAVVSASVEPNRLTELSMTVLQPARRGGAGGGRILGFVAVVDAEGELLDDAPDILVFLEGTDHTVAPGADGRFEFSGLEPRRYTLSARAEGCTLASPVQVDLSGGGDYEATLFLQRVAGSGRGGGGTVTGEIALAGGEDPRGATIGVAGSGLMAVTDSSGRFTLEGVPPGQVMLVAQAPGYAITEIDGVEITAGETTDVGRIELDRHRETPRVIATSPTDGTRDVLLQPQVPVFIRFNVPMDPGSVHRAITVNPDVPHSASIGNEHPDADDDVLLIFLAGGPQGLDHRDRVRIRIGTEAESVEGVPLRRAETLSFTMGEPALYSSIPQNDSSGFPNGQVITLFFNARLRTDEAANAFEFSPDPPTLTQVQVEEDPQTGWSIVYLLTQLSPNTLYRLRLSRSLHTVTGQRLGEPREIEFRTAPQMVIDN
ncbi:carboxypeptidase regulatory-like domain-containing protein, partial [Candidatus Sumerlaeota bacterium]|nr:carboxypeptidase regulatory-like domain-containing protein [Candidatus Sumerlaeota bacterium]